MFLEKKKGQRNFVPITPEYHSKKNAGTRLSFGSAIILISIIIALLIGFWTIGF